MSHRILIGALEFVAAVDEEEDEDESYATSTHYVFTLLTTQRQLFNSLAPVLTSQQTIISLRSYPDASAPTHRPEPFFRLLMRSDTFRFATSLHVGHHMTTESVQEILGKMDCVINVKLKSAHVDDRLTPTLLALPRLERVNVPSYYQSDSGMTYHGATRPLLKHPRESVRRSVAASTGWEMLSRLSAEESTAAFRDDIIPLIDSASCNAAVLDYLALPANAFRLRELPQDIIMMLGDRLFQFFTAANSHFGLISESLRVLCLLAELSAVDVFKEWPVLEVLPDMLRSGVLLLRGDGVLSVIRTIFRDEVSPEKAERMRHHQQRFFELQIPDIMYDVPSAREVLLA